MPLETPDPSEVEGLVRAFFAEAINGQDMTAIDRYCVNDYVWNGGSDPGGIGVVRGRERFKAAVSTFFTGFPDMEAEILDLLVDGDRVCVRFRETGTHLGPFVGIPPTGRKISWDGIGIYRVAGGRMVEEWFVDDSRAIFEQLGAIPVLREDGF